MLNSEVVDQIRREFSSPCTFRTFVSFGMNIFHMLFHCSLIEQLITPGVAFLDYDKTCRNFFKTHFFPASRDIPKYLCEPENENQRGMETRGYNPSYNYNPKPDPDFIGWLFASGLG